jgi:hypothetical protein
LPPINNVKGEKRREFERLSESEIRRVDEGI